MLRKKWEFQAQVSILFVALVHFTLYSCTNKTHSVQAKSASQILTLHFYAIKLLFWTGLGPLLNLLPLETKKRLLIVMTGHVICKVVFPKQLGIRSCCCTVTREFVIAIHYFDDVSLHFRKDHRRRKPSLNPYAIPSDCHAISFSNILLQLAVQREGLAFPSLRMR